MCASTERLSSPDPKAQAIAQRFARAWIEAGWHESEQFVSSTGPTQTEIERDHDFFVVHEFVIVGDARFTEAIGLSAEPGYEIPAFGLDVRRNVEDADLIQWTTGLFLVQEDDAWKVAGSTPRGHPSSSFTNCCA
ncbi:MAG: hypothetical protein ACRD1T_08990 [Acidimicrobiia bacterium]